jgi:hypothetical protein
MRRFDLPRHSARYRPPSAMSRTAEPWIYFQPTKSIPIYSALAKLRPNFAYLAIDFSTDVVVGKLIENSTHRHSATRPLAHQHFINQLWMPWLPSVYFVWVPINIDKLTWLCEGLGSKYFGWLVEIALRRHSSTKFSTVSKLTMSISPTLWQSTSGAWFAIIFYL